MILYYRALLEDLGIPQHEATIMFEDNRGALFMANAQQPSNHTRHIDIKTFALTDWVEQDLMILIDILSSENCAEHLTKALPKTLLYRHTAHSWEDDHHNISRSKSHKLIRQSSCY
jgi:hypothetical protein